MRSILSGILFLIILPLHGQDKKNVVLLDNWTDTTVIPGPEEARFNDVWGFEYEGSNYAVMGSTTGSHFFKVTENSLEFIDFVEGRFSGYIVQHRDYKTYQNYVYAVCDEGESSLQIIDVSYLPDSVSLVYDSDSPFVISHNIFIDTIKAKLYACAPNGTGLKIFDISEPTLPLLDYEFNMFTDVHDCYVSGDTAFLNCGFAGLQIFDFATKPPIQLGVLDFYPNQGYNHSGWMNESRSHYVFMDETEGTRGHICKVSDLSKIQIDATFGTQDYEEMVPHNVFLLENIAIVAYYKEGLRIFDVSDVDNKPVREIGSYDTYLVDSNYKLNGAWGVYVFPESDQILISDRQNGLFLFEFPIRLLEEDLKGTYVTSTPFLDENGYLISRDHFDEDDLYFTITSVNGRVIYNQENYLNWVKIPLNIAPGTYVYGIFDGDQQILESGKCVKAN